MSRCCLLMLLLLPTTHSLAATWTLDPVHTRVAIAVDHAGFSRSLAVLSIQEGQLHFDAAHPGEARVTVAMDLRRLDFGDERWNQAIQGRSLLDVARHPVARFTSRQVTVLPDQSLQIDGDLTLRGVTAPVRLTGQLNSQRRHPMPPYRQTVGFSASGTLSRQAFGASAWSTMVGDTVSLQVEVEATRSTTHSLTDNAPSS